MTAEFDTSPQDDAPGGSPGEEQQFRALRRALLLHERRSAMLRRRQRGVQPRRLPVPRTPRADEPPRG